MGRYQGLLAGLGALAAMFFSLALLSGGLQAIPWERLAARRDEPAPVAPIVEPATDLERGLLPSKRTATGSVPLYRETRPPPAFRPAPTRAPGYSAGAPRALAPAAAPTQTRREPRAAALPAARPATPGRFVDQLPSLGERFGAGVGAGLGAGGGSSLPAASPATTPVVEDSEEPAPAGAWDQGAAESPQPIAPRARRPMRALPQSGVTTAPVEAPPEAEEEPDQSP